AIQAGGTGIDYGGQDQFNFMFSAINGDGTVVARLLQLPDSAQAGIMIREGLGPNAQNAYLVANNGVLSLYYRSNTSLYPNVANGTVPLQLPLWLKLSRQANNLVAYTSPDGMTWTQFATAQVSMASSVYAGLAVSSNLYGGLSTSFFDNVSISTSASGFSISVPSLLAVSPGSNVTTQILQAATPGFSDAVAYSIAGLPSSATANFTPASISGAGSTTLALSIPQNVAGGVYQATL